MKNNDLFLYVPLFHLLCIFIFDQIFYLFYKNKYKIHR